jgi:hypothetical protein
MAAVLHIGPPKTATTALQQFVIPNLGRPYEIKPVWGKLLTRSGKAKIPQLPADIIVSDESWGQFSWLPPAKVAARLAAVFPGARIIYTRRDPVELFYSYYRQRVINLVREIENVLSSEGRILAPISADKEFDRMLQLYREHGIGFFAMANPALVRASFEPHFGFELLEFSLLEQKPTEFVQMFCAACDSPWAGELGKTHVSSQDSLEEGLALLPYQIPADIFSRCREYYAAPRLSNDRTQLLREYCAV